MTRLDPDTEFVLLADVDGPPLGRYRPDQVPRRNAGLMLRQLAGVKEEILDWVPEERPRYTRLGAIILNTGLLATLSMLVALTKVIDVHWIVLMPVAVVWGFLVLTFDGWLIASTHGTSEGSKLRVFVPRLIISILMGAFIAEPMVLAFFQPAIDKEVLDFRQAEIAQYESQLTKCNPVTGDRVGTAECADFQLNLDGSPDAIAQRLDQLSQQRERAHREITEINQQLTAIQNLARAECSGQSGPGLTGRVGEGPNCRQNRRDAAQFRSDSRLDQRQIELDQLDSELVRLTGEAASVKQNYASTVTAAIAQKVDEKRRNQGMPGLLDEIAALSRLADRNTVVWAAEWLVRLLLIAIDTMPVFVKMIGGSTVYDDLFSRQTQVSKRLHEKYVQLRERRDSAASDIRLRQTEQEYDTRVERLDAADRSARGQQHADLEAQIDALAAQLLAPGAGAPAPGGKR